MSKQFVTRTFSRARWIVAVIVVAVGAAALMAGPAQWRWYQSSAMHVATSNSQPVAPATRARVNASYAALPLAFEANQGQTDPHVTYMARANGYTLFLTPTDAIFSFHSASRIGKEITTVRRGPGLRTVNSQVGHKDSTVAVHMRLLGGNAQAKVEASDLLPGKVNYFIGNDPGKWRANVSQYGRVSYQNVYPGVDMAFHGAQHQLEFDFTVAPGADPARIDLGFTGARKMATDPSGNLVISSSVGDVTFHRPVAYQQENGNRQVVDTRFVLKANHQVGFQLGSYDRSRELVIDPSVTYATEYSTFVGGSKEDDVFGIALDATGNTFVVGATDSSDFPVPPNGPTLLGPRGGFDVFISELSPAGALIFTTFLGGTKDDFPASIALDGTGIYIAGTTQSVNFPVSSGAAQAKFPTKNTGVTPDSGFAVKLSLAGNSISWATYLGGNNIDTVSGLAVDNSQNVYVVGTTLSTNFGGVTGGINPLPDGSTLNLGLNTTNTDGFIAKVKSGGTQFLLVSYLGGSGVDSVFGVAVNPTTGHVYVSGSTTSTDLPTNLTPGVFQPTCGTDGKCNNSGGTANTDAFVAGIDATTPSYIYLTYLGGELSDVAFGIAVDTAGNAYLTGKTNSTKFPIQSALFATLGGSGATNAFVTELNPGGSALVYSTYLGGTGSDEGDAITLDSGLNAYLTGTTTSKDFPKQSPTQSTNGGGTLTGDAFVSEVSSGGSSLLFSTYLGGSSDEDIVGGSSAIAVDSSQNIYVVGDTNSDDFPTLNAFDGTLNDAAANPPPVCKVTVGKISVTCPDGFVVKYALNPTADFGISASPLSPATVQAGSSGSSTVTVVPVGSFGGTVALSCGSLPSGVTCTFNPTSVTTGGWTSSLSIGTSASTPLGVIAITLQGMSAAVTHTTEITLNVIAPVPDFTISGTALAAVNAGGSSTSTITIASVNSYAGTVNLTCKVTGGGKPAPTCAFDSTSVSGGSGSAKLTVSTTAPIAMLTPGSRASGVFYALLLPIVGVALLDTGLGSAGSQRRNKKLLAVLFLGLVLAGLIVMPACVSSSKKVNTGTPPGTYTINVTGTDSTKNSLNHSISPALTLTVN